MSILAFLWQISGFNFRDINSSKTFKGNSLAKHSLRQAASILAVAHHLKYRHCKPWKPRNPYITQDFMGKLHWTYWNKPVFSIKKKTTSPEFPESPPEITRPHRWLPRPLWAWVVPRGSLWKWELFQTFLFTANSVVFPQSDPGYQNLSFKKIILKHTNQTVRWTSLELLLEQLRTSPVPDQANGQTE